MAKNDNSGIILAGLVALGAAVWYGSRSATAQKDEPVKIPIPPVPPPSALPPYAVGKGWYTVDPNSIEPVPGDALSSPLKPGDKVTFVFGDDPDAKKATVLCQILATVKSGPHFGKEPEPLYLVTVDFAKVVHGDANKAPTKVPPSGFEIYQFRNKMVAFTSLVL